MPPTLPDFLHAPDGEIMIVGHRIGLHHVVRHYREGFSPEMLWEMFPTLSLATIHKCIAFYLENREAVNRYIVDHDAELERMMAELREQGLSRGIDPEDLKRRFELRQRLEAKRMVGAS